MAAALETHPGLTDKLASRHARWHGTTDRKITRRDFFLQGGGVVGEQCEVNTLAGPEAHSAASAGEFIGRAVADLEAVVGHTARGLEPAAGKAPLEIGGETITTVSVHTQNDALRRLLGHPAQGKVHNTGRRRQQITLCGQAGADRRAADKATTEAGLPVDEQTLDAHVAGAGRAEPSDAAGIV